MFIKNYSDVSFVKPGPQYLATHWAAHFHVKADITVLFPYINSEIEDAVYYEKPHYIYFTFNGFECILHPDEIVVGYFETKEQSLDFIPQLIDFLNDIFIRKDSIKPNYKKKRYIPVLDIYKLLPRTNCKECGFPTCMAFAASVSKGDISPDKCPALKNPMAENVVYPIYDNNGNIVSTIAIDIDSQKRKYEFEKQKEYARSLEKKIVTITKDKSIDNDNHETRFGLTGREIEVLQLMAEGLTNTEISNLLSISPHTVKSHVIHIFNKIGVNDRTQASVWATRHKLI